MEYTITRNEAFNSLEITFDGKPSEAVRDALKALRFRWHSKRRVWYGYTDEETARAAIEGKPTKAAKKSTAKANRFGVKVGDLFHASWGYDQTNNDFFQVVALVGETSVRVREVNPVCEQVEGVCWAAEDRVLCTNTNGELLPPAPNSFFVKDNDKGDIKRLSRYDETSAPGFKIASYAWAYKCSGDTIKVYESWYA